MKSRTFLEVGLTSAKHGWTHRHREANVWRYERDGTVIDVAYTFGGGHNIQTIHVMQPGSDWWLTFKAPQKKATLLGLLEDRGEPQG